MKNYTIHTYLIECISNLHVGSGENNYGVVDKQVQRDPITGLPIIHASGLKGALREYFETFFSIPSQTITDDNGNTKEIKVLHPIVKHIFGSDKKAESDNMQQGKYRFFDAHLLSLPVRGLGAEPFYSATTNEIVKQFKDNAKNLGLENEFTNLAFQKSNETKAKTEYGDFDLQTSPASNLGEKVIMMTQDAMTSLSNHLPIIARNSLDNGQSSNLWYEEIVPRKSRFYFMVAIPKEDSHEKDLIDNLHNQTVQIGANATVGYGYCKITKI